MGYRVASGAKWTWRQSLKMSRRPEAAAMCRGVWPSPFCRAMSDPGASRFIMVTLPVLPGKDGQGC